MADDEDDIVFDRSGLLNNHVKPAREVHGSPGKTIRHKGVKTLLLCVAFLGIGMCIAIPGPTLTSLQEKLKESINSITWIYFARALGYLAGSIFGGMLFDWLNQQMVIAFALIITSITTICIPFSLNLSLMNCFIGLQGLSMGVVDTGGNALLMYTWGRKSGPYMQALHFSFGLGAFIAPLIAAPFLAQASGPLSSNMSLYNSSNITLPIVNATTLAPVALGKRDLHGMENNLAENLPWSNVDGHIVRKKREKKHKPDHTGHNGPDADGKTLKNLKERTKLHERDATVKPSTLLVTTSSVKTSLTTSKSTAETTSKSTTKTTTTLKTSTSTVTPPVKAPKKHSTGNLTISAIANKIKNLDLDKSEFAYLTISMFMLLISFVFWFSCCRDERTILALRSREAIEIMQKESRSFKLQILLFIFCFYFCYKGLEITFGQFISTFVKLRLGWSEEKGAFVVALFWGMFALTRAMSICFAKYIGPTVMLIFDLAISTIALLVLLLGLKNPSANQELVIWASSALFGMGLASILPTGFTWAERYMEITGKTTSVFLVGSALGEMIIPLITGYFMHLNPEGMSMVYVLFACCLVCSIVFIILQNMASRQGERVSDTQRPATLGSASTQPTERLEMEPIRGESSTNRKKVTFNIANESAAPRAKLKRLVGGQKAD